MDLPLCDRAIAYLKPAVPRDDAETVIKVSGDDEPVIRNVAPGLLEL